MFAVDARRTAHVAVEDHRGENIIGFPELTEALLRAGLSEHDSITAAQGALLEFLEAGELEIFFGPVGDERGPLHRTRARELLDERERFTYGNGGEARGWFLLD